MIAKTSRVFRELCSVAKNCPLMSLGISYLSHAVCSVATLRPSRKQKSRFLCNFFAIADRLSSLWDRRTADLPCFRAIIHDLASRGNSQSQKSCSPRRFSVFRFPRCFKSGAIGGVDLACLSQLSCGAVGREDLKQRCCRVERTLCCGQLQAWRCKASLHPGEVVCAKRCG